CEAGSFQSPANIATVSIAHAFLTVALMACAFGGVAAQAAAPPLPPLAHSALLAVAAPPPPGGPPPRAGAVRGRGGRRAAEPTPLEKIALGGGTKTAANPARAQADGSWFVARPA